MKKKGQDDPLVGVSGGQWLRAEQRARPPASMPCQSDNKKSQPGDTAAGSRDRHIQYTLWWPGRSILALMPGRYYFNLYCVDYSCIHSLIQQIFMVFQIPELYLILRINKAMIPVWKNSSSVQEMEISTTAWNTVFSGPREAVNKEQWKKRRGSHWFCCDGNGASGARKSSQKWQHFNWVLKDKWDFTRQRKKRRACQTKGMARTKA